MENKKHLKTNLKPIKKEKNFVIKGDKIILKRNKYGAKIRPNTKGISKTSRRDALNEFDKKELKKARISFRKILNQNVMKHTKLKESFHRPYHERTLSFIFTSIFEEIPKS